MQKNKVSEQNFEYRISTAKVLLEKSEFTSFPNFKRKLAILEGKLKIQHNHNAWYSLESGEQTDFSGDWKTRSEGQVVDFNVIYKDNYQVEIEFINQVYGVDYTENIDLLGFYCINGMGSFNGEVFHIGDFIHVQESILEVETSSNARFIQVKITKL